MTDTREIYWLAGLLEGEGSFIWNKHSSYLGISMHMTDRDVVLKAASIMDGYVNGPYTKGHVGTKPLFKLNLRRTADAAGWMMTLYPLLGSRRKSQIQAALAQWKLRPARPGFWFGATCHPDKKRFALTLCRSCYEKARRKRTVRPESAEESLAVARMVPLG